MEELIILVNAEDEVIGYGEKQAVHVNEQLHRAFSLFIYSEDSKELLLHRRAWGKYHSGGLWTNACCSHPRKGEELRQAVLRRMEQELGIRPAELGEAINDLAELGSFTYYHRFADCAEHEVDHVFLLRLSGEKPVLSPDSGEIAETMWVRPEELFRWMEERPEEFTAWFPQALRIAAAELPEDVHC